MLATPVILHYPDRLSLHRLIPLTLPSSYNHMALPHALSEGTDTGRTHRWRGAMTLTMFGQYLAFLALRTYSFDTQASMPHLITSTSAFQSTERINQDVIVICHEPQWQRYASFFFY